VDIQERAPGAPKPGGSQEEADPSPSSAKEGDRREEKNEWPSLEEQRRRAEEEYDKLGGLSHGCRQSWDLRMREERGPGRKINRLFHWISEDSLILHEVARAAGLEGRAEGELPMHERRGIHMRILGPAGGLERGNQVPGCTRGGR
jgi:hypothetical protein